MLHINYSHYVAFLGKYSITVTCDQYERKPCLSFTSWDHSGTEQYIKSMCSCFSSANKKHTTGTTDSQQCINPILFGFSPNSSLFLQKQFQLSWPHFATFHWYCFSFSTQCFCLSPLHWSLTARGILNEVSDSPVGTEVIKQWSLLSCWQYSTLRVLSDYQVPLSPGMSCWSWRWACWGGLPPWWHYRRRTARSRCSRWTCGRTSAPPRSPQRARRWTRRES